MGGTPHPQGGKGKYETRNEISNGLWHRRPEHHHKLVAAAPLQLHRIVFLQIHSPIYRGAALAAAVCVFTPPSNSAHAPSIVKDFLRFGLRGRLM